MAAMELGCRGDGLLLVPDLSWPELISVLRRQISRELLSAAEGQELLEELLQLPLRTEATATLCPAALQRSQQQAISVHNACYLALALRHGAVLLSADQRLAAAARRCGCAPADGQRTA